MIRMVRVTQGIEDTITDAGNWRLAAAPASVPLPAALPLLASGILGVFGWRLRGVTRTGDRPSDIWNCGGTPP